jgi:hypothetical protein
VTSFNARKEMSLDAVAQITKSFAAMHYSLIFPKIRKINTNGKNNPVSRAGTARQKDVGLRLC